MGSHWHAVRVVATDPARLARWWAEVLGYRILDEHADRVTVGPGDGHPYLSFAPGQGLGALSRVHLDITVDDPDTEVERLVDMGARPVDEWSGGALVLADPEGNPFTLLRASDVATSLDAQPAVAPAG
jgi:catechol 2,3-dioxygenase-like lactoylglutathione lyase family enzyme